MTQGDQVSFWYHGIRVSGRIVRVNKKTITCDLDDGRRVRASLELFRSDETPDNLINFPHHACGVGSTVWFLVGYKYPLSGVIQTLDRHGANVVPDNGCAEYYRVAHSAIHPTREEAMRSSRKTMSHQ